MKRLLLLLCMLPFMAWSEDLCNALQTLGFENIAVSQQGRTTYVALEDNVYRGTYRGLYVALQAISPRVETGMADTIVLVQLVNQMPRVTVNAVHDASHWTVRADYGDNGVLRRLHGQKRRNSSVGKVDFVIAPEVMIDSLLQDHNFWIDLGVTPTIEMTPWHGARLSAGVTFSVINTVNTDYHYPKVRPSVMSLSQQLLATRWLDATLTAGLFRVKGAVLADNRWGADLNVKAHLTSRVDAGVEVGYTGAQYFEGSSWKFSALDQVNALASVSYYEPLINCQIDLKAGRFVYGDCGAKLSLTRRLAEYAVGCYGAVTSSEVGMGVYCSIPIGAKRKMRRGPVRISLPQSMNWEYCIQNYAKAYTYDKHGVTYMTTPEGEYSNKYYQVEYIAKYLSKMLNQ